MFKTSLALFGLRQTNLEGDVGSISETRNEIFRLRDATADLVKISTVVTNHVYELENDSRRCNLFFCGLQDTEYGVHRKMPKQ